MAFASIEDRRKYHYNYWLTHKEKFRQSAKRFRDKRRSKCFEVLGSMCACCKETEMKFLQIDHINGGGRKERNMKNINSYLYRRIEIEGYPKDKYQILCSNCNWAKGIYGCCPHKGLNK